MNQAPISLDDSVMWQKKLHNPGDVASEIWNCQAEKDGFNC